MQTVIPSINTPPPLLTPHKPSHLSNNFKIFAMAHRLAVASALLMCVLALAHARMYETILSNVVEETNPHQLDTEKCSIELHRTVLTSCSPFLQPFMLFPSVDRKMAPPQRCCDELRGVSKDCRCQAIREITRRVAAESQGEQKKVQEVRKKAQMIPQLCRVEPQYCQMNQDNEC